ncbi:MAG: hypothetical protein JEZ09_18420 [Salinivirgaceae bacterium]|nr:hypothetical protein [Salinivirgaceae bacterium]
MKRFFLIFGMIMFATLILSAQGFEPVAWEFSAKKVSKNTFEIHLTASIDYDWQIYAQTSPEGGALPTQITFIPNSSVVQVGKVKEIGNLKKKYERVFGIVTEFYRDSVDFVQIVNLKTDNVVTVKGSVYFMACKNDQCLPPKALEFSVILQ